MVSSRTILQSYARRSHQPNKAMQYQGVTHDTAFTSMSGIFSKASIVLCMPSFLHCIQKKSNSCKLLFSKTCAREDWRRPIVPEDCSSSIVGARRLNDRVRDGNGCDPSARVTNPPAHTSRVAGVYHIVPVRRGNGGVLLSRRTAPQVSLGLEGLTTVFEMGTGVTPLLESPIPLRIDNLMVIRTKWRRGDSNPLPSECKSDALPIELRPRFVP